MAIWYITFYTCCCYNWNIYFSHLPPCCSNVLNMWLICEGLHLSFFINSIQFLKINDRKLTDTQQTGCICVTQRVGEMGLECQGLSTGGHSVRSPGATVSDFAWICRMEKRIYQQHQEEQGGGRYSSNTNRAKAFRVAGDGRWWREWKADGKITSNMFIIVKKHVVCLRGDDSPQVKEKYDWVWRNTSTKSHTGVRKRLNTVCIWAKYLMSVWVFKQICWIFAGTEHNRTRKMRKVVHF